VKVGVLFHVRLISLAGLASAQAGWATVLATAEGDGAASIDIMAH
jgi:hypothetical protein